MPVKDTLKVARKAFATLDRDRRESLLEIDRYERGDQELPYTPELADAEYLELAHRSITNIVQFLVATPAQMMYVDSFRRGRTSDGTAVFNSTKDSQAVQPEWDHWQNSRLDARQSSVIRGALKFGHSFVLTEKIDDKVISKGLSALKTVALFADPASDDDAYATLTITEWPDEDINGGKGKARLWDDTYVYDVRFTDISDPDSVAILAKSGKRHGAKRNPVTRFTAAIDLEGRTCGVVEPMIVLQNRINQTVFDLLIVQSYASFKVRTISGMTPPMKMRPIDEDGNTITDPVEDDERIVDWVPVIGSDGQPIADEVQLNAKRVLIAADSETKFNTLDETPLDGFISAIDLAFRHMAALSQMPPHYLLGQISNLSAEALNSAETSLLRKVNEFKASFGESWERVFRVAAEIGGIAGADDFNGEVIWRDVSNVSLAQSADALGKFADNLEIPKRALWSRVPGVTANELSEWQQAYEDDQQDPQQALADATNRINAASSSRPTFRLSQQENANNLSPGSEAA